MTAASPKPAADVSAIIPLPATVADNTAAAFAPVAGEASLARVVRTMLPAHVVVAAAAPLVDETRESLAAHGLSVDVIAASPGTRAHCLVGGLEYVAGQSISVRYVLVHDIRRPLTPAVVRDRVVARLSDENPVVMPSLALTDSVKAVDARGAVKYTLDRSTLQTVQYPRGFSAEALAQLLARRTSDEFDEVEEVIRAGAPIALVDGDHDAFPAELPRDAAFIEAIIACRRAAP